MKVIFSKRAYVSLLTETAEKLLTETGGIFLGQRNEDAWYIIEAIDPGPKSIFQPAYFEYDQQYVTHLANKLARIYKTPLQLIGLWHRHPGSFCQFSSTDDKTNMKFASLHKDGAISALVNIDPNFRLTVFHASLPLNYQRISYQVDDSGIPKEYLCLNNVEHLEDFLSGKTCSQFFTTKKLPTLPSLQYSRILTEILCSLNSLDITSHIAQGDFLENLDDHATEKIIGEIEEDTNFLSQCGLDIQLHRANRYISLHEKGVEQNTINFYVLKRAERCILSYKNCFYIYKAGMFRAVIEDVVSALQKKNQNFMLNEEFVECSVSRLRKK